MKIIRAVGRVGSCLLFDWKVRWLKEGEVWGKFGGSLKEARLAEIRRKRSPGYLGMPSQVYFGVRHFHTKGSIGFKQMRYWILYSSNHPMPKSRKNARKSCLLLSCLAVHHHRILSSLHSQRGRLSSRLGLLRFQRSLIPGQC